MNQKTGIVAATAILFLVTPAQAVIVDHFDAPQLLAADFSSDAFGVVSDAAIVGLERDMYVDWTGGFNAVIAGAGQSGNSLLQIYTGPDTFGTVFVDWDGPDADPLFVDHTGLGPLDITFDISDGSPLNAIGFEVAFNDVPIDIVLYVASDASNYSTAVVNVPGGITSPQHFYVLYNDFVPQTGAGANFSSIGAGGLIIDTYGGVNLAIDYVESLYVPEPSGFALGSLGVAAACSVGWLRRRRRSRSKSVVVGTGRLPS